ncbi:hypothetical protein ACFLVR_04230 [Chloroflexota bacterium]
MSANEAKYDKFKRLANSRTNEILRKIKLLGNLSNNKVYEYSKEDISKIFGAIDKGLREAKTRFSPRKEKKFSL